MNTIKRYTFFFCLTALLLLALPSLGETARDITADATITASTHLPSSVRVSDRDFGTIWNSLKGRRENLEITTAEPCYGVYLCSGMEKLRPWIVEVQEGKNWTEVARAEGRYGHEYLPLEGLTHFRVRLEGTAQQIFSVNEIFLLSEGDLPDWVQLWQPTVEKADLMILAAHPDDEILFFGGMIPTYAGELQKNVVVCYMTCGTPGRRSELLNGLWYCGVRTYPDIGSFWDKYHQRLDRQYNTWGQNTVWKYITALFRRYKPEVVATHDVNGEYGHGAHRVCADACLHCVTTAADASKYKDSAKTYGAWQVKKLYIHLYPENQTEFDWDVPLKSQGGKTGFETAVEAYKLYVSQQKSGQKNEDTGEFEYFNVEPRDSDISSYRFGLAYTAVGPDTGTKDLFENIPSE